MTRRRPKWPPPAVKCDSLCLSPAVTCHPLTRGCAIRRVRIQWSISTVCHWNHDVIKCKVTSSNLVSFRFKHHLQGGFICDRNLLGHSHRVTLSSILASSREDNSMAIPDSVQCLAKYCYGAFSSHTRPLG